MACNFCSLVYVEKYLICQLCGIKLCDNCFNKTINTLITDDGIIHDSSHSNITTNLTEEKIYQPSKLYISFTLKDPLKCIFTIDNLKDFKNIVSSSKYLTYKIYNLDRREKGIDLFCKQTDCILLIREFLDSLNYPEDFINCILKDLLNDIKEYKFVNISFSFSNYNLKSEDSVFHLKYPLLFWKGYYTISSKEINNSILSDIIKTFKEYSKINKSIVNYSASLMILKDIK